MKTRLNPNLHGPRFQHKACPFIVQNAGMQDPGEVGEANASPNTPTKPRKCGPSRVSTARVWPGGHTLLVGHPGSFVWLYPLLVSSFELQLSTKWSWILGFNRSILRGIFSTGFQPLDFALIQWVRFNSDLIQNFGGLWAHFSSSPWGLGLQINLAFN